MLSSAEILVIFDLDFTLIDNSHAIFRSFEFALKQFHLPAPQKEQILKKIGIPLKTMFLDYLDENNAEKAVHYFREYYREHYYEGVRILPGSINILEKLKKLGYKLALLTSKKTEYAIKLLEHINLKNYFEFIQGEQPNLPPKPNPASIHLILTKFQGIKKAFMIGDHLVDCLAAKKAGINFIGVLTGIISERELRQCAGEAGIILKSIADLDPFNHLL